MQTDPLAQVRKADAFAVACHLLQYSEGAPQRLHADALPALCVVAGVGTTGRSDRLASVLASGAVLLSAAFAFVRVSTK